MQKYIHLTVFDTTKSTICIVIFTLHLLCKKLGLTIFPLSVQKKMFPLFKNSWKWSHNDDSTDLWRDEVWIWQNWKVRSIKHRGSYIIIVYKKTAQQSNNTDIERAVNLTRVLRTSQKVRQTKWFHFFEVHYVYITALK